MRRFEFVEGGSRKFWEIDQAGAAFTVRFGRMDTAGQSKTTACASADEAVAEVGKLIREKVKKGYQEIGAAVARTVRRPPVYSHYEHVERFMNYPVVDFDPEEGGLKDLERKVYAVRTDYDSGEEAFTERLEALLADPRVGQLKGLVIGTWFSDGGTAPDKVIAQLVAAKDRLTGLTGIFLGDIVSEESDIAYINQADVAPLLRAFPKLEEFVVRGGNDLRFAKLQHDHLRTLIVQSGGLSSACIKDLAAARLPALERVALWLGTENYGGDYAVTDLGPVLRGEVWPKLDYLGLMNAQEADALAAAVATAPVLARVSALDLSMGALTDEGGQALLASAAVRKLAFLNLKHHYLSDGVMAAFRKLGIDVDVTGREEDDDYRSCEVTE